MLEARFADPVSQAWLGLWVGLFAKHGAPSRLTGYVRHDDDDDEESVTILDRASLAQVLGDAPIYFKAVRVMRRYLPDDYELFRRIGCVLIPHDDSGRFLARGRIETYPSFVACIWPGKYWDDPSWEGKETERDKHVSISVFKRVRFPGAYLPWGDVTYEWLHMAADLTRKRGGGEAAYIGVESATGKARVLAQPSVRMQRLPNGGTVQHTHVGVPQWVRDWHRDDHKEHGDLHDWVSTVLSLTLSHWRAADKGWQVHLTDVEQHPVTMRLCIPERAAKTFFRDRQAPEQGRLKPIFHIVAEHERVLGGNRSTTVRQHYRGNRAFSWNGYKTLITVPGHHHRPLSSLDIESVDEADVDKRDTMTLPALGRVLATHIRRAVGLHSYKRGF